MGVPRWMSVITERVGVMEGVGKMDGGRRRRKKRSSKKSVLRKVWTGTLRESNGLCYEDMCQCVQVWQIQTKSPLTLFSPVLYVSQRMLLSSLVYEHTTTRSEGWAVYPKEERIFKLPAFSTQVSLILLWLCACVGYYYNTRIKAHTGSKKGKLLIFTCL